MIIPNGTVQFKTKTGGGLDMSTGYPVAATEAWSAERDCQYYHTHLNLQRKDGGEHATARSIVILLDGDDVFTTETLLLKDDKGAEVGVFPVISVEQLRAVNQTKITI